MPDRPRVSVVVPFAGDPGAADALVSALGRLTLREGDEVIVADNNLDRQVLGRQPSIRVVHAREEQSSYYARNRGAEAAANDWILFMDADCTPEPPLLDAFFSPSPGTACGIVAGAVVGDAGQSGLLARWARSRRHLSEEHHTTTNDSGLRSAGITGNLLVRRELWESLGGFHEGIRSGGDIEFCWRAQDAGRTLEHRPAARVAHRYDPRIGALARQAARHNAGRLWVRRRYPETFSRPKIVRPLARCLAGSFYWLATGRWERGAFKVIDAVSICGGIWGWYAGSNQASTPEHDHDERARDDGGLVVMTEAFPARSETFVYNEALALETLGRRIRIESSVRPAHVERFAARGMKVAYLEDDPPRRKLASLLGLVATHPVRCLRDRRDRRRWSREEDAWSLAAIAPALRRIARSGERQVHAHFAAGAALNAMRASRILGIRYSVTAHAYDLFQKPRNLAEKLEGAAFVAGECDHTVDYMRGFVSPPQRSRIHRIATGADPERFQRKRPQPGSGRVVAVGRHVEKKGFSTLVRAVALLRGHPALAGLEIAGEGPLRSALEQQIRDEGVADLVSLRENVWGAGGVSAFLEDADLLVIPAVLAADGDRDALPVISYEALAMEVPVVASDLVGLPEVVQPPWGLLVPPGDVEALARAIAKMLELSPEERAERGRRGREWVELHGNPAIEVERLSSLFDAPDAPPPRRVRQGPSVEAISGRTGP